MNSYQNTGIVKTKGLVIYSIVCLVILYGGLGCSYAFWKNFVDGQFGLVMPFTFLFFVILNMGLKVPALVDVILLAVCIARSTGPYNVKSRKTAIGFLIVVLASGFICVAAEFLMLLSTEGSSLG